MKRARRASESDATARFGPDGDKSPSELWAIDGELYDLESIGAWHPGGGHILDVTRGTDCTEVFFSSHPTVSCKLLRQRLRPHWRAGGAARSTYDWSDTEAYDALKRVVASYGRTHGLKAADYAPAIAWYAAGWMALLWMLLRWAYGPSSLTNAALFGLCLWLSAADTVHSGSHGAISRSFLHPGPHQVVLRSFSALFCFHAAWVRQHILGHHPYTNTEADPDMYHHPQRWIGWRVAPFTVVETAYRRWRLWFTLGVWLTQTQPSVINTSHMIWKGEYPGTRARVAWAPRERLESIAQLLVFTGCLLLHARSRGPVHTLLPFAVCGALFYVFSQISHVNDASFPQRNGKSRWAHAQAESARGDYSQDSYVWGVLSIGLNNQTMHHLFPTVHYCHYPCLQKLLRPVFKIHKLPVPAPQTFAQSVRAHFAFLGKLNDQPEA